jgi:hypothetical protein
MINHYLKSSIKNIEDLISLTKSDIEDIKQANNDAIYKRTKIKDEIIDIFESQKSLLDSELVKLMKKNEGTALDELLSKEELKSLDLFKKRLKELHGLNKDYARLVVAVNEFYTSLFDKIFPTEMENYKKTNPKSFSLLKVSA